MNKQFFKYIGCLLLLAASFSLSASAQDSQAEAKLKDYTIKIGDQTRLFLQVHQPAKEHINFPKLADTLISKVQVVSAGKLDTVYDTQDHSRATITQTLIITSFDAGTYTIPAFSFGTGAGVLKTNDLTLQVQTVKVDTTKAIYDIKQPFAVSYTFWDWLRDHWILVVSILVIVLVIVGIIWYLKTRPEKIPVLNIVKPVIPPHTVALNKLKELRDKKLWQQDQIKLYYSELSDVLREYLEKRFEIKTYEKTTDEIFAGLKYVDITDEKRDRLRQILVLSDLVKFAKEKPVPAENEQTMDRAIDFVTGTKQVIELPKTTDGGSADDLA